MEKADEDERLRNAVRFNECTRSGQESHEQRLRRKGGQFLLNKEVSRTKQLMSLRLGGPARGFVLITSRRDRAWRGAWWRGTDSAVLLLLLSTPIHRFLFLSLSLSLSLSFIHTYARTRARTHTHILFASFSFFSRCSSTSR